MNMNNLRSTAFPNSSATVASFSADDVGIVYDITFVPEIEGFISAHVWHGTPSERLEDRAVDVRFDCWGVKADGRAWGHTS